MANNYWKDFKNLFKSKQRLQEEESQAVGEAVKKEESILEKLKALEAEYKASVKEEATPDFDKMFAPVTLDRVKYDVDSDEEIEKAANDSATAEYAAKISDINADAIDRLTAAEEKKGEAEKERTATLKEIGDLYEALRERTKNDSVKQGISRSSIVDNQMAELDQTKVGSEKLAHQSFADTVKSLDSQIEKLEKDRLTALNDLDIQKAVAVSEEIKSFTTKREKTLADETVKNNAVQKQETELNAKLQKEKEKYVEDYYADRAEQAAKQEEYEKRNGYSGEKQANYASRYNLALEFYLSLDPDIAPKALEASGNMKYYLGNYYDKLMDVLTERNSQTRKYI